LFGKEIMLERFSKFIMQHRKHVILVIIVITIVFGYFIRFLRINPDFTSYLPREDPVVTLFDKIGTEYGGNLLSLVALEADDIFDARVIRDINDLTTAFKTIDGVSYVMSITNVLDIKAGEDGIEIGRLIDQYDLPTTKQELSGLKQYVMSKEMYRGRLISEDGKAALIICRLRQDADEIAIARQMKQVVAENDIGETCYFGGLPPMMREVSNMIINDLMILLPLVTLLIILTLFISFRSLAGVILPVIAVGMSTVWTLGLMSMLNVAVSIVSDIIPVILFAVGSAYSIHVISRLGENTPRSTDRRGRLEHQTQALSRVILPVKLAAFTTMVGFISFVLGSYLTTIREFGIFATCGVLFAYIISITFVPALTSLLDQTGRSQKRQPSASHTILHKVSRGVLKHTRAAIGISIIFIVMAVLGIPRIQRKVDILDYFKPGTDIRLAENFIKEKFGGSMPIQIIVKGDITDPEVLNAMKNVQEFLESHQDIENAHSVADLIEEMSFIIGEGRTIPQSRDKVSNLWFLLEGEEIMSQLANTTRSEAIIQATLSSSLQTDRVKVVVNSLNEYLKNSSTDRYTFTQTGMPSIHYRLDESIKRSQVQSIIIAGVAIFITVLLLLRSFYGGLIGLIPITFSLLGIFGFMGIMRIPLDIATVLVGSVSIGIGIDYSIHFLNRYKAEYERSRNARAAVEKTLQTTGRAILINVTAVTAGFLALLLANLIPLQRFGILIAITMLASGYGAVVILPAILVLTNAKTTKVNNDVQGNSTKGE
jgi:predicted RND superfamily exporter protein